MCRVDAGLIAWRVPRLGQGGAPRTFKLHWSPEARLHLTGDRGNPKTLTPVCVCWSGIPRMY